MSDVSNSFVTDIHIALPAKDGMVICSMISSITRYSAVDIDVTLKASIGKSIRKGISGFMVSTRMSEPGLPPDDPDWFPLDIVKSITLNKTYEVSSDFIAIFSKLLYSVIRESYLFETIEEEYQDESVMMDDFAKISSGMHISVHRAPVFKPITSHSPFRGTHPYTASWDASINSQVQRRSVLITVSNSWKAYDRFSGWSDIRVGFLARRNYMWLNPVYETLEWDSLPDLSKGSDVTQGLLLTFLKFLYAEISALLGEDAVGNVMLDVSWAYKAGDQANLLSVLDIVSLKQISALSGGYLKRLEVIKELVAKASDQTEEVSGYQAPVTVPSVIVSDWEDNDSWEAIAGIQQAMVAVNEGSQDCLGFSVAEVMFPEHELGSWAVQLTLIKRPISGPVST